MTWRARIRIWSQTMVLILLAFALPACREVVNPNPPQEKKKGLVFFNYYVESPTQRLSVAEKRDRRRKEYGGMTLRLFVWTNCLPASVLNTFSDRFGAEVSVAHYDTDGELHERLVAGELHDIIMPRGSMVQKLILERRLAELDHQALPHLTNLEAVFRTNIFDSGYKHAIPYFRTTSGIAFNHAQMDHIPRNWGDLFEPDAKFARHLTNRISLLPGPTRAIAAALIHLGYSPNTYDTNELHAAAQYLEAQAKKFHFQFIQSQLPDALVSERILLAQAYSYHASVAAKKNHNVHFAIPEDGIFISTEHFAIPRAVAGKQKALAEAFLNFVLEPFIAGTIVNFSHRATTVSEARAYVEPSVKHGPAYAHANIRSHTQRVFFQQYTPVGDALRQEIWKWETNELQKPTVY